MGTRRNLTLWLVGVEHPLCFRTSVRNDDLLRAISSTFDLFSESSPLRSGSTEPSYIPTS